MKKILFVIAALLLAALSTYTWFNSPPPLMHDEAFLVKPGESLHSVGVHLKEQNLIRSVPFFKAASYITMQRHIRTGKYKIYKDMTTMEIFRKLASGEIITRKVTIPEGFNLYQIAERLDENDITGEGKFLYAAFDGSFLQSIGIRSLSAEGYLFPDTYVFPEDCDARDVIIMMHKRMQSVLKELGARGDGGMSVHEILTLASLVEEEAQVPSERPYIASVFHNRLARDWRMDCDPTVRYAVKKFTGSITLRDLETDSPYNTYKVKGLPPTPITSPGRDAIKATVKPMKTSYLFFVARNDGSHYFSKTLREHNKAVLYYQRGEKVDFRDNQKL
ncbi:MAG: endolytic transglycosylase MltG [Spirochaetae bacterium HGW-Spirochaetae-1]|jgi:UPF0755 protein|nr:MAG: endolytic transglycosylase MltG [Spirochaetae bacterium HGW-Spirochaetae-1]